MQSEGRKGTGHACTCAKKAYHALRNEPGRPEYKCNRRKCERPVVNDTEGERERERGGPTAAITAAGSGIRLPARGGPTLI